MAQFDNAVDSGLLHTFNDNERIIFARETARVFGIGGKYFMLFLSDKEPTGWGGPRRMTKEEIEATFSPFFNINYGRDAFFATRFHDDGGGLPDISYERVS